jgi:hypothetical protein
MPVVKIEPTDEHPVPYDTRDAKPDTFLEDLTASANTAELQHAMGVPLELDPEDSEKQKRLIEQAIKTRKASALTDPNTAFSAASFLRSYGSALGLDVAAARSAITNKLMEIANCGDPKYELKALELLGKHSDIGLFTERSEVTINYKNPEDLENAIKERVKRLLNATVIDVTPSYVDLDAELGFANVDEEEGENEEGEEEGAEKEKEEE